MADKKVDQENNPTDNPARGSGNNLINVTANLINPSKQNFWIWFLLILAFIIGSWYFGFRILQTAFNYIGIVVWVIFILYGIFAFTKKDLDKDSKETRIFIGIALAIWLSDMWPQELLGIGNFLGPPFSGFEFNAQGLLRTNIPAILTSAVFFAMLYVNMVFKIIDREYIAAALGFLTIIIINFIFANFFPSAFDINISIPWGNMLLILLAVGGLIGAILLDKKRGQELGGYFSYFFMIFVIAFFLLNRGWALYPRAVIHAAYIIFFGFIYIKPREREIVWHLLIPVLLILDFFGVGWLWEEWGNQYLWVKFIPLLVLFVLFYCYDKTKDTYALASFIALVTLILILSLQAYGFQPAGYNFEYTPKDGKDLFQFFDSIKERGRILSDAAEYRIEEATGGLYRSEVEKNQFEPLGVYFDRTRAAQPKFYSDEDVTLWSTIRSRTLNDPVVVNFTCSRLKEGVNIKAKNDDDIVLPNRSFTVYSLEETDVECTFTQGPNRQKLDLNTNEITLSATYNFETSAYHKLYFIDRNRQRAMTREGITDVLGEYGITDKNPITIHTNGPVEIAVNINNLIPVSSENTQRSSSNLGVLLRNREIINGKDGKPIGKWQGTIKKINQLVIITPHGVELDLGSCRPVPFRLIENYQEFCGNSSNDLCSNTCEEYIDDAKKTTCQNTCRNSQIPSGTSEFDLEMQDKLERKRRSYNDCISLFQSEETGKDYNAYEINVDELKRRYPSDFTDATDRHRTFVCGLLVSPDSLDNTPITTKFIRVLARYDYSVNQKNVVSIENAPEASTAGSAEQIVNNVVQSVGTIEGENVKVGNYLISISDLKGLIYHESRFIHCCQPGNNRAGCKPSSESNCPSNRILTSFDGSSVGIMQINARNHYLANQVCPVGQTVLDRECNIKIGLELLRRFFVSYNNGASSSILTRYCPQGETYQGTDLHSKYAGYRGFDAVLRAYNGWSCKLYVLKPKCDNACSTSTCVDNCLSGTLNYVERIKENGRKIQAGQLTVPDVPELNVIVTDEGAQQD